MWKKDANSQVTVFRRVRKIARSDCYFRHTCLFVCPSTWNNSAPTGKTSL